LSLSDKIDERKKLHIRFRKKIIKSVQNETQNKIENVIKGLENKVSSDKLEIALNQHTEETYASKVKKTKLNNTLT